MKIKEKEMEEEVEKNMKKMEEVEFEFIDVRVRIVIVDPWLLITNLLPPPVKVATAHPVESLVHLNNHTQSYWNNVVPSNTNHYE